MNVWEKENTSVVNEKACCAISAVNDARRVCSKLDIPYYVMDFRKEFESKVIDYFVDEYIKGRTPNPCIACNKYIKFEELLNKAVTVFDADYIATGHYAKVECNEKTGRYYLRESVANKKDQTYALYNLTQDQLKHILMPLGEYTKDEVRKIANENELINANKHDSQEICFIEDNDYAKFIAEKYNYKAKKGDIVDKNNNILGRHTGIINYTIGQRRGLGLSVKTPVYVLKLDVANNKVIVGDKEGLFSNELICTNLNFMPFEKLEESMEVKAKIRYSASKEAAVISPLENGNVKVKFKAPQRAITPGQAVVFYKDDIVIGGGTII